MDKKELMKAMKATAAAASTPRPIEIKGWGTCYVRSMLVSEVEQQTADTSDPKNKQRLARAAARVMCDEKGTLLFDAANEEEVGLLAAQPWSLLNKVLDEAQKDLGN